MKKIILFVCAALLAVSCVYPFSVDDSSSVDRLVVFGDIIVGDEFEIRVSKLEPLYVEEDAPEFDYSLAHLTDLWVEGSDGSTYKGDFSAAAGTCKVNMKSASTEADYRLHFVCNRKEYISDWRHADTRVAVDSLYYQLDFEKNKFRAKVDFHADGSSKYFSVTYKEVWEYTAAYKAKYEYIPRDMTQYPGRYKYGLVQPLTNPNYRCWNTAYSRGFQVLTSESLTQSVFKDVELASLNRTDSKLSNCYFMEVSVMPVAQDAYEYMNHIDEMANSLGDLFSPNPSEMRGNIRCVDDPDEFVIGFVSVTHKSTKSMYVIDSVLKFYKTSGIFMPADEVGEYHWPSYYNKGWVPFDYDPDKKMAWWTPFDCADCRAAGGTRTKPEGWPTKGI
ncbi:MAG: DUF4249 domain-containing protein [Bacteroidales bacterium]|nr:DUF4249 domain-containing protein [Bacteroidales bacterium]